LTQFQKNCRENISDEHHEHRHFVVYRPIEEYGKKQAMVQEEDV
jgi:hypothetical protein